MGHTFEGSHFVPVRHSHEPLPMKSLFVALAGVLSFLYLLNPTLGVFEFIPDNLPLIGNIDEATATMVLLSVLRYFGWDITDLFKKKTTIDLGKHQR